MAEVRGTDANPSSPFDIKYESVRAGCNIPFQMLLKYAATDGTAVQASEIEDDGLSLGEGTAVDALFNLDGGFGSELDSQDAWNMRPAAPGRRESSCKGGSGDGGGPAVAAAGGAHTNAAQEGNATEGGPPPPQPPQPPDACGD